LKQYKFFLSHLLLSQYSDAFTQMLCRKVLIRLFTHWPQKL